VKNLTPATPHAAAKLAPRFSLHNFKERRAAFRKTRANAESTGSAPDVKANSLATFDAGNFAIRCSIVAVSASQVFGGCF
jgi:hypothetical protein